MKTIVRVFCLSLLGLMTGASHAQSTSTPDEIESVVTTAFSQSDFAALDRLATKFRVEKSRAPSGSWNLMILHSHLVKAMNEGRAKNTPDQWRQMESKVSGWIRSKPDSVVAPILLAKAHFYHAYVYRGEGFANTVTEEGWKGFGEQLSLSRQVLEKYRDLSSVDPEWYTLMLRLARNQRWEPSEHTELINAALKAEPLYYSHYMVVAESLLPKWGGSMLQVQAFTGFAVQQTNATDGQALYARIYRELADANPEFWKSLRSAGGWSTMKLGFQDMVRKYPDEWNKNSYAKYACSAGDVDVFIHLAREIDGKPMPDAWPGTLFQRCKDYAAKVRPNHPLQ